MNYKEYKEARAKAESKAFGEIKGVWTFIAYLLSYRAKELFVFFIFLLLGWIVTIIINPSIAESIKKFILR